MKSFTRVISKSILLLSALLTIMACCSYAYADPSFSNAKKVNINSTFGGNLTKGYDYQCNTYKFSTPNNGYLKILFNNPEQFSSEEFWTVQLYNSSYQQMFSQNILGNTTSTLLTPMGLSKGTYYLNVQSTSWADARSTDKYKIQIKFNKSDVWEKEFNENFRDASAIKVNKSYYGTLRNGYDYEKDFYTFTMPSDGYITLKMKYPRQSTSDDYWKVIIYNNKYEEITSRNATGNVTMLKFPQIGIPKGKYYVSVQSTSWNTCSHSKYSLYIACKKSSYWEKEFNDSFVTATKIVLGKNYYGSLMSGYDYECDYYKLSITNKKTYKITINSKLQSNSDEYWEVYIYNSRYEEVGSFRIKGNNTTTRYSLTMSKGTYYFKLKSRSWNSSPSDTYSLNVS